VLLLLPAGVWQVLPVALGNTCLLAATASQRHLLLPRCAIRLPYYTSAWLTPSLKQAAHPFPANVAAPASNCCARAVWLLPAWSANWCGSCCTVLLMSAACSKHNCGTKRHLQHTSGEQPMVIVNDESSRHGKQVLLQQVVCTMDSHTMCAWCWLLHVTVPVVPWDTVHSRTATHAVPAHVHHTASRRHNWHANLTAPSQRLPVGYPSSMCQWQVVLNPPGLPLQAGRLLQQLQSELPVPRPRPVLSVSLLRLLLCCW
jgi:hypothetical protein